MTVWFLLCVVIVLWFILFRFRRRKMYKLAAAINGSKTELPIIGIAHKMAGGTDDVMRNLQLFNYEAMENDGILRCWIIHLLFFIVTNPEDNEMILKTCLDKDDVHRVLRDAMGQGTIFAPVQMWRLRRKVMVPMFTPKILHSFVKIMSKYSERVVEELANKVSNGSFSIWHYISTFTLNTICESAMGTKINSHSNFNETFLRSMNSLLDIMTKRVLRPWLHPHWLFKLFPIYSTYQENIATLHGYTNNVIEKKRAELEEAKKDLPDFQHSQYNLDDYQNKSFLDLLISLSGGERGYTNMELREEIFMLTIAGTDTSAVAICNTLLLLGKYPKIQEQVYDEICTIIGNSGRPVVKEDLGKLNFLERVVKETIRLFPPVPIIVRKVDADIKLPSGRILPQGAGAVVSIWGSHRDPKYWGPDAEHFDPDRFLPERFNLKHACSYMPFSNGPRNCVAYQYALLSVKTALATILRSYRVVGEPEEGPIPHIDMKLSVMMKAVDDYHLSLERRKPYADTEF